MKRIAVSGWASICLTSFLLGWLEIRCFKVIIFQHFYRIWH